MQDICRDALSVATYVVHARAISGHFGVWMFCLSGAAPFVAKISIAMATSVLGGFGKQLAHTACDLSRGSVRA